MGNNNNMFAKWNKEIDTVGLKEDIKKARENGGDGGFEKVPFGTYDVMVESMELKPTKAKKEPMVAICFKILAGKCKGRKIYMNQVITKGVQIHISETFLKSLGTDLNVDFDDYEQYAELIMDIHEAIEEDGLTYALKYEDNKGYDKCTIKEVFEG